MMEVDSLQHATLATVSRCGMVWFAQDTVSLDMMLKQQLNMLRRQALAFRDNVAIESISGTAVQAVSRCVCFLSLSLALSLSLSLFSFFILSSFFICTSFKFDLNLMKN